MKQIIVIHGGDSFSKYDDYIRYLKTREVDIDKFKPKQGWKKNLEKDLGGEFEVLMPQMPNPTNAVFDEWKIWFERMFPFMQDEVVLVGHSLGGMFLAKYLSQNNFPKKITQLHLVAPPHNQTEDIADFFLLDDLRNITRQSPNTIFYFSEDDELVPFSEMDNYKSQLPDAKYITFKNRGHFKQEIFPELIDKIRGAGK